MSLLADVELYLHYGCPWTYLAFVRLQETAMRTSSRIVWKPVLIERVQRAAGVEPPDHDDDSPRARYGVKDLADWARFCGVTVAHEGTPAAEWAARGGVVAAATGEAARYGSAIFRGRFEQGADLHDLDAVTALATDAGMDSVTFRRAAQAAETLAALERNSDELIARGGFGSPTMFVGDDMYFGNDRLPLIELALTFATDRPLIVPGAHGQM